MYSVPHMVDASGRVAVFKRTTLREAGHNEAFLEARIKDHPDLLGLDPLALRLSGKFVGFTQTPLRTPTNREVYPDIIFLTDQGDVVVVEVKLSDNAELRGRHVLAQVIEYAASMALLDDVGLAAMFSPDSKNRTWSSVIAQIFPAHASPGRLADVILNRLRNAEIHLVIATDSAPDGLREMVRSVGRQAALGGYLLHVAEIQAYRVPGDDGQLLLVPQVTIETEIVATTSVQVSYPKGTSRPNVKVTTNSAAELKAAMSGQRRAALAPIPEFEAVVAAYNLQAPDELQLEGEARSFRHIVPPRWPGYLHYELLKTRDELGIELHIEDDPLLPLQQPIKAMVGALTPSFPNVVWDPAWMRERGRIRVAFPLNTPPAVVAQQIEAFIAATRAKVEAALEKEGLFED